MLKKPGFWPASDKKPVWISRQWAKGRTAAQKPGF